jgi:hypothetical protein
MFSVWSVPRLYNEGQLLLRDGPDTAVRKAEVSVRWPPACEDLRREAEDRRLLEDVTKQSSEDRD